MEPRPSRYLTPLMRAAAVGHLEIVEELLNDGADVNERGPRDSTALMFAAGGGHLEIARMLVERGADIDAREAGGWTALCHAKEDNDGEMVTLLELAKQLRAPSSQQAEH
ncbi:MAG: ankyrin repeat domain-containing protein [Bdellovibrionota bacterium]